MSFSFAREGNSIFLVYRLLADEQLDRDAYGMLRSNAPLHVLAPVYSQFDGNRELRYDVTGYWPMGDFVGRHVFSRQQHARLLAGIAGAYSEAREFMLAEDSFAGSLDLACVDDSLEVKLVYVPIVGYSNGLAARDCLRAAHRAIDPVEGERGVGYLAAIDGALSDADGFSLDALKRLLASLMLGDAGANGSPAASADGRVPDSFGQTEVFGVMGGSGAISQANGGARSADGSVGLAGAVPGGDSAVSGDEPGAGGGSGGMAIPGGGSTGVPDSGKKKKGGLFRKGKSDIEPGKGPDKRDSGKKTRAQKKAEKAAAKAQKKAEKEQRKAAKGKRDGKSRGGGRDFVIPTGPGGGADAVANTPPQLVGTSGGWGSGPAGGSASGSADWALGVNPVAVDYSPSGDGSSGGFGGASGSSAWTNPAGSGGLEGGSAYVDDGFGLTEVYGVQSLVAKKEPAADAAGSRARAKGQVLSVKARLTRIDTGESRLIDKPVFKIGRRESQVDFHVADRAKVSRVHAVVTYEGGAFGVRDNDSLNHTELNGRRLAPNENALLEDGDVIAAGDVEFRFELV